MIKNQLAKTFCLLMLFASVNSVLSQGFEGYYQFPDIHDNQIVFCAEGDIWTVPSSGGLAQRLTTHAEDESYPIISPDGQTIVFSASYEGPTELYSIPINGGMTTRWTYESEPSIATAWTPDGEIVYASRAYNKKPDLRLVKINLKRVRVSWSYIPWFSRCVILVSD